MSHQVGAYLGGVRSVECLRQRSRICAETGCWHWSLCVSAGHARVWLSGPDPGQRFKATGLRAAWQLHHGCAVPSGRVLWRTCRHGDCVNPAHVRCGTAAERGAFWTRQGWWQGQPARVAAATLVARTHRAKLTLELAREIRASAESQATLAARYGVAQHQIHRIKTGKGWRESVPVASVFSGGASHGR